jgi:uncharacterized protein YkwD
VAIAGSLSHIRALFACATAAVLAVLVPAQAEAAAPSHDKVERSVISRVNAIRTSAHLPRLRPSRPLAISADFHSADMLAKDFFGHPSSNGEGVEGRVDHFRHFNWVGETLAFVPANQAAGQASRIVSMWMNSPPHRASLLDRRFSRIGVGRRTGMLGSSNSIVFTADLASAH